MGSHGELLDPVSAMHCCLCSEKSQVTGMGQPVCVQWDYRLPHILPAVLQTMPHICFETALSFKRWVATCDGKLLFQKHIREIGLCSCFDPG